MLGTGLTPTMAKSYTQMGETINGGLIQEDYRKHKPAQGKLKLGDFAKRFAVGYNK